MSVCRECHQLLFAAVFLHSVGAQCSRSPPPPHWPTRPPSLRRTRGQAQRRSAAARPLRASACCRSLACAAEQGACPSRLAQQARRRLPPETVPHPLLRFADDLGLPCVDECAVASYPNLPPSVHPGVVTGQALPWWSGVRDGEEGVGGERSPAHARQALVDLLQHAKENRYAIPAVNCVTSSSVNTCLEAARKADAPIIIQFSSGGTS